VTRSSERHDPPAWTKPGARWIAWLCWPMLVLCLGLTVWRIAEGSVGQAFYQALLSVLFGSLLIRNRANRRARRH
jgi:hypothetical protein